MAWRTYNDSNEEMVKNFKQMSIISSKQVEDAFLNVPRAAFLPEFLHDEAYADYPVRGDDHLHMSAPHMYATVLEALNMKEGMSFLNIGSGTGYFSMLAGYIVGSKGLNHGIELRGNLVEHANDCCEEFFTYFPKLKKTICFPQFIAGNCFHVDQTAFKYDRVYCGAACPREKFDFLLELLKPDGLVIVPTGNKLLKLERHPNSGTNEKVLSDVCFESLVLPEDGESFMKLRFTYSKQKAKKIKVYPCPGLLIPKTAARKTLSRMRALQDVIDSLTRFGRIPKSFTYVPSFAQLSQLAHASKSSSKLHLSSQDAVDETVNFFNKKTRDSHTSKSAKALSRHGENIWNELQDDLIWENVVNFTYSLCRPTDNIEEHVEKCFQLYTKVKKRPFGKKQRLSKENDLLSNLKIVSMSDNGLKRIDTSTQTASSKSAARYSRPSSATDLEISRVFEELEACGNMLDLTQKTMSIKENFSHLEVIDSEKSHKDILKFVPRDYGIAKSESSSLNLVFLGKQLKTLEMNPSRQTVKLPCIGGKGGLRAISVDLNLTNELQVLPSCNWSCDEDTELVQFLVNSHGGATSKMNGKCQLKHISVFPTLFTQTSLVRHPKISSYPPESLTFRALALLRVVHVMDCVIPFLCSTALNTDLNAASNSESYPSLSFTENSFSPFSPKDSSVVEGHDNYEENDDVHFTSGMKNIEKRRECLTKKLHLRQNLTRRFKEQQSLIKKQMQLFDEQKTMMHRIEAHSKHLSPRQLEQLRVVQERITENKTQRNDLFEKQTEILRESESNEEEMAALQKQMEYLEREEENFKQFMGNLNRIKRKTDPPRRSMQSCKPYFSWTPDIIKSKSNSCSILYNLRFLLPLSNRRAGILAELLRATEQPLPEQVPVVYIDRKMSVKDRLMNPKTSVFYQIFESLKSENVSFRWNKRKCDQWWEVKFVGEGIIDQGGGFRDSLSEVSDELCPPAELNTNKTLPLLVKTVNNRDKVGDHRDCFVPNPSCRDMKAFHWLGRLMGAAYRSDESLALFFPPYFWKLIVSEHVTWHKDFVNVDALAVNMINNIEVITKNDFETQFGTDLDYTTANSDGTIITVKHCDTMVNYESRFEYCELVKKARMMESLEQIKAIRSGILTVIPQSLLELITSQELEKGVCGFTEISMSLLKESIHYGDELSSDSECVQQLWKVLENFSLDDRSRFLRFVTGRKRLPACITLSQMSGEKDTLPGASTCASTLMLPSYSSVEVAEKKLRYAIYNCVAIDTDTSPW
ncbi:uncharacterized protein LOC124451045 [Xenia sp. Carnegie-2017]|uniref:uncharacterized protein LOC124451045 n=1 Tax=Xenia sp. Carnegie-2017 TaxID=2897299 RepID=UPI001F049FE8|nr:uncharacterized protein LOC124451045 [Xenia sp. Carnegie-2017]